MARTVYSESETWVKFPPKLCECELGVAVSPSVCYKGKTMVERDEATCLRQEKGPVYRSENKEKMKYYILRGVGS